MNMTAQKDFESRFFDMLQESVVEVKDAVRGVSKKVDKNTAITQKIEARVDKLDGKVFGKKSNPLSNLFQDRQIILAFVFSLLIFLLILASVLHVKVPTL